MTVSQASSRQLGALGFCAFSVPAVLMLPRAGWLWATLAAGAVAALLLWALRLQGKKSLPLAQTAAQWKIGKVLLFLALLWNLLLLGAAAKALSGTFPDGKNTPLVGLLLLLLAAYAAKHRRGARVAAILFFFLLGLYGLLFGFSLTELRTAYLAPVRQVASAQLSAALAPLCLLYLSRGRGKGTALWCVIGVALAFVAAFMTAGILSPTVVQQREFALYEAAKSVSIFGVIGRLEPLVSAALSLGGFCLLYLICAANGQILQAVFPEKKTVNFLINFFAGAAGIWLCGYISAPWIALGTAIFWGLFPIGTLLVGTRKKVYIF